VVARFLEEPLRSDRDLAQLALRSGADLSDLPPAMRSDRGLVLLAVSRRPWDLAAADAELRADPEIVRAAVVRDAQAITRASAGLQRDVAFLRSCALENPLLADQLGASVKAKVLADPQVARAREELDRALEALGIRFPRRFHDFGLLRRAIDARLRPDPQDARPLAVMVYPREDYNRAFESTGFLPELMQGYRVLYYEAESDGDLTRALQDASGQGKAELLMIGGHGERTSLAFGAPDPAQSERLGQDRYLDVGDEQRLRAAGLQDLIADDADVMLVSCSTGQGEEHKENLAAMVSRVFPKADVWAPTEPTNIDPVFDERHRMVSPGYFGAAHVAYFIDRGAPG